MLPGTLTFDNGMPTNEVTQGFTYGMSISFEVTLSGLAVGTAGPYASSFFFTLYDATPNPLGTGPNGASASVDINADGTTTSIAFAPFAAGGPSVIIVQVVPEPAGLSLLGVGFGLVSGWSLLRRRRAAR